MKVSLKFPLLSLLFLCLTINKSLNVLKANIEEAKNKFSSGSLDFEDVYKSIIN